ncbi:MAG: hypothetical protein V5A68_05790 [Candidatus Thermoplasmatota archaeon]
MINGFSNSIEPQPPSTCAGYNPENGTVKLIAIDTPFGEGVGVDETYYKLNGGDIQVYETPPIQLRQGKNTIEFWSVDKKDNIENHKTIRYTFDNYPSDSEDYKTRRRNLSFWK